MPSQMGSPWQSDASFLRFKDRFTDLCSMRSDARSLEV